MQNKNLRWWTTLIIKNSDFQKTIAFIKNKDKKGYGIFFKIPFIGIKSILSVLITSIDLILKNELVTDIRVVLKLGDNSYTLKIDE